MDIWWPVMKNAVEPVVVAADHVDTLLGRVLPALQDSVCSMPEP
jgi:hypothetical protein